MLPVLPFGHGFLVLSWAALVAAWFDFGWRFCAEEAGA
jgi:hypothetical protein